MLRFDEQQIKARAKKIRDVAACSRRLHDVELGIFAEQLVLQTMTEVFRHEYPELKWINGGLIPIDTSFDEGIDAWSYTELDQIGRAEIVSPNATDVPLVDLTGRNNIRGVVSVADGFTYSNQDLRTARTQGLWDLVSEKGAAARVGNDRRLNPLIAFGDAATGIRGVTNSPGIVVQTATNGGWQTQTGVNIVADVTTFLNSQINSTDGVLDSDTCVMDTASFTRISTLVHLPNASDRTVLSFLKEAFPMINRWDFEASMGIADAAGTGPAMLAYKNDPSRLKAIMPMPMTPLPAQAAGLSWKVLFETRWGGIKLPSPENVYRLDGIGA